MLSGDYFTFDGSDLPVDSDLVVTKRSLLSVIARWFDPLGFMCPFVISAKILFQSVWCLGLDWDCELLPSMTNEFHDWMPSIDHLQRWYIYRYQLRCRLFCG